MSIILSSQKTQSLPVISIITVCLNALLSLKNCISSVNSQKNNTNTPFSIEYIIIDGASTDGTVPLLQKKLLQGEITQYISEPDTGIYDAMNKGLQLATGTVTAFLNADDTFTNSSIVADMVTPLLEHNTDFTYAEVIRVTAQQIPLRKETPHLAKIYASMPFCHQSFFCRTDLLRQVGGFDTQYRITADMNQICAIISAGYIGKEIPVSAIYFNDEGYSATPFHQEIFALAKKWLPQFIISLQNTPTPPQHSLNYIYELLSHLKVAQKSGANPKQLFHYTQQLDEHITQIMPFLKTIYEKNIFTYIQKNYLQKALASPHNIQINLKRPFTTRLIIGNVEREIDRKKNTPFNSLLTRYLSRFPI